MILFIILSPDLFETLIKESKILLAFPRVMGLFLRSEAPGLVFSEEKTAASHQSLQKSPTARVFMSLDVNNLMLRVIKKDAYQLVQYHFVKKAGKFFALQITRLALFEPSLICSRA
jgi:hypothetical protein